MSINRLHTLGQFSRERRFAEHQMLVGTPRPVASVPAGFVAMPLATLGQGGVNASWQAEIYRIAREQAERAQPPRLFRRFFSNMN